MAEDFARLGLTKPIELKGKDPWEMYVNISSQDGVVYDPCVLDTYLAAVDDMRGGPPKVWWEFTAARKRKFGTKIDRLRAKFNTEN